MFVLLLLVNSLTQFEANLGVGTLALLHLALSLLYLRVDFSDGNITAENENLAGRMIPTYAGITTTISSIANASTDQVYLTNDLDVLLVIICKLVVN